MEDNNSDIFRIQRMIAIIASGAGFIVFIVNLVHSIEIYEIRQVFLRRSVLVLFISSVVTLFTGFRNSKILRTVQIGMGIITGAMAILDDYDSIFGIGLFLVVVVIAFRYGYFRSRLQLKAISIIVFTFSLVFVSARLQLGATRIMVGLNSIFYMSFFILVLYQIYSDEIKKYMAMTKKAESTVSELINQREKLQSQMDELSLKIERITTSEKPVDLKALGITKREEDVLRVLIIYREKEEDIAKRLGIGYQTVKTHFKHIRNKLGVDRREEIIDMCRNNF